MLRELSEIRGLMAKAVAEDDVTLVFSLVKRYLRLWNVAWPDRG